MRYISTYRDGRRKSTISLGSGKGMADDEDKPVPKWKFWKKKEKDSSEGFEGKLLQVSAMRPSPATG